MPVMQYCSSSCLQRSQLPHESTMHPTAARSPGCTSESLSQREREQQRLMHRAAKRASYRCHVKNAQHVQVRQVWAQQAQVSWKQVHTLNLDTSLPTSTTTPRHSWPGTMGNLELPQSSLI